MTNHTQIENKFLKTTAIEAQSQAERAVKRLKGALQTKFAEEKGEDASSLLWQIEGFWRKILATGQDAQEKYNDQNPVVRDVIRYITALESGTKKIQELLYEINVEIADLEHLTKNPPLEK